MSFVGFGYFQTERKTSDFTIHFLLAFPFFWVAGELCVFYVIEQD